MKTKAKILASLLVIFAVVLSTGAAYAVSPFGGADSSVSEFSGAVESNLSSRFVLEDDSGAKWNLNIAFGVVMYGTVLPPGATKPWPAYGFIFGKEMVLWADGPGTGGWIDSLVQTGMWDFGTMKFSGFWVNYPPGSSGSVQMWPVGGATSGEETGNGQKWIAQSSTASNTQDSGISPTGAASGERIKTEQNIPTPFGDISDRGAICFEDTSGFIWDLDMAYGCILYGTVDIGGGEKWPAYGFIFSDEMFLWADGPGTGGYVDSSAYTGTWDFGTMTFSGFWVNYPPGSSAPVELWPCGALKEYIIYHADYGAGIWRMNPDGTDQTQLTTHGWFAEYSPDNTKIAFGEYYQNGIWVMNADGTGQRQLTNSGNAPTWSPDGKKIAYQDGDTTGVNRRIWVMNADGTGAQKLSDNPGSFPKWSPDGKKIAYHGEVNNGIWLINPDGSGETQLYNWGGYPAWSSDSKQIAYVSLIDWCIWTMNADGTGKKKLTDHSGISPTWSPDGKKIAYEDLSNKGIWVINADGSNDLLINEEGHAPDWSSLVSSQHLLPTR